MMEYRYTLIVLMALRKLAQFCGKQHDTYTNSSNYLLSGHLGRAPETLHNLEFLRINKCFKSSFILQTRKLRLSK